MNREQVERYEALFVGKVSVDISGWDPAVLAKHIQEMMDEEPDKTYADTAEEIAAALIENAKRS